MIVLLRSTKYLTSTNPEVKSLIPWWLFFYQVTFSSCGTFFSFSIDGKVCFI